MNMFVRSIVISGLVVGGLVAAAFAEDASLDELVLQKTELKITQNDAPVNTKGKKPKQVTPTSSNIPDKPAPEMIVKDPRTGFIWAKDRTFGSGAILRTLNKITARTSEFRTSLHQSLTYGNLDIIVRSCWHSPADEKPESKALMEIWETVPGKEPRKIFFGWMLSSSPSISGLEHPVYDVVVKECF